MKNVWRVALYCSAALFSSTVLASGYQSFEQGVSGLGNAYAGQAAIGDDATTEFYNPAAMVLLDRPEVDVGGVLVMGSAGFVGDKATNAAGDDIPTNTTWENPLGKNLLPDIHVVVPLNKKVFFGFGITVPFGLETDYRDDGMARYFATESKVETMNVNPSIAYKLNNHWSIAGGINFQYLRATLDQQVDTGLLTAPPYGTGLAYDSSVDNVASDYGVGWNAGILYQFDSNTRVGFHFRSAIDHSPKGKFNVTLSSNFDSDDINKLINDGFFNDTVSTDMTIPETATLSVLHMFSPNLAAMASVNYVHWSVFDYLTMRFGHPVAGNDSVSVHEDFHDTFRYAVGVNYKFNQYWTGRLGFAYDESPVNDNNRTLPLPDANRLWFTAGLGCNITKNASVNLGYGFIHIGDGTVNQTGIGETKVDGHFKNNYAQLVGLQLNVKF